MPPLGVIKKSSLLWQKGSIEQKKANFLFSYKDNIKPTSHVPSQQYNHVNTNKLKSFLLCECDGARFSNFEGRYSAA